MKKSRHTPEPVTIRAVCYGAFHFRLPTHIEDGGGPSRLPCRHP